MSGVRFPGVRPLKHVKRISDQLIAGIIPEQREEVSKDQKGDYLPFDLASNVDANKLCVMGRDGHVILPQSNVVGFVSTHNSQFVTVSTKTEVPASATPSDPTRPIMVPAHRNRYEVTVWSYRPDRELLVDQFPLFAYGHLLRERTQDLQIERIDGLIAFPNCFHIAGIVTYWSLPERDYQLEKKQKASSLIKSVFILDTATRELMLLSDLPAKTQIINLALLSGDRLAVITRNGILYYQLNFANQDWNVLVPPDFDALLEKEDLLGLIELNEHTIASYHVGGTLMILDYRTKRVTQIDHVLVDVEHAPQKLANGQLLIHTENGLILYDTALQRAFTFNYPCRAFPISSDELVLITQQGEIYYRNLINLFSPEMKAVHAVLPDLYQAVNQTMSAYIASNFFTPASVPASRFPKRLRREMDSLLSTLHLESRQLRESITVTQRTASETKIGNGIHSSRIILLKNEYRLKQKKIRSLTMLLEEEQKQVSLEKCVENALGQFPEAKAGVNSRTASIFATVSTLMHNQTLFLNRAKSAELEHKQKKDRVDAAKSRALTLPTPGRTSYFRY